MSARKSIKELASDATANPLHASAMEVLDMTEVNPIAELEMTEVNPMAQEKTLRTRSSMSDFTFNIYDIEKSLKIGHSGNLTDKQKKTLDNLKKMDRDGDGDISLIEILALEEDMQEERRNSRRLKKILCGVVFGVLFCLASIMCMGIAAVEITKETRVEGGNPVAKATGAATVPQSTASKRRRRLTAPTPQELKEATELSNMKPAGELDTPDMGAPAMPADMGMTKEARTAKNFAKAKSTAIEDKDLTGTELVKKKQDDYNVVAANLVKQLLADYAAGDYTYSKEELEKKVPGMKKIKGCMFVSSGTVHSYPITECPTKPMASDPTKTDVDEEAIRSKTGPKLPVNINLQHTAFLMKTAEDAGESAYDKLKEIAKSAPTIVNGAPRLVSLSNGMGTNQLKGAKKVILRNKVTGEKKEFVAKVTEKPQEEDFMAGNIEIEIPSSKEGVAAGKMTLKGDGSIQISKEVREEMALNDFAPELASDKDATPESTEISDEMYEIIAETDMSLSGKDDDVALQEMFPDSTFDSVSKTVKLPEMTASPNVMKENQPGTIIKIDLKQCDQDSTKPCTPMDDVEMRLTGEKPDPETGDLVPHFALFKKTITETSIVEIDTSTGPTKCMVSHTKEPFEPKGDEPMTPDMTEIAKETVTISDGEKQMTKVSEICNPHKMPPMHLPEGATGVHNDGTFFTGEEGTETQADAVFDVNVQEADKKKKASPEPLLNMIAMAKEVPKNTLSKRRLSQLDSRADTRGSVLARAHLHARHLLSTKGGAATVYEVEKDGRKNMIVEHCGSRSAEEKEALVTLKAANAMEKAHSEAAIQAVGSRRRLSTHLHSRKLAVYARHISVRVPRSHRRLASVARKLEHQLAHVAHRHERATGRRLRVPPMDIAALDDTEVKDFIGKYAPKDVKEQYEGALEQITELEKEMDSAFEVLKQLKKEKEKTVSTGAMDTKKIKKIEGLLQSEADVMEHIKIMETFEALAKKGKNEIEEIARSFKSVEEAKKAALEHTVELTKELKAKEVIAMEKVKQEVEEPSGKPLVQTFVDPVTQKKFNFDRPKDTPSIKDPNTFFADVKEAKEMHKAKTNLKANLETIQTADAAKKNMEEDQSKCQHIVFVDTNYGPSEQIELSVQQHKINDKDFKALVAHECKDVASAASVDELARKHKPTVEESPTEPATDEEIDREIEKQGRRLAGKKSFKEVAKARRDAALAARQQARAQKKAERKRKRKTKDKGGSWGKVKSTVSDFSKDAQDKFNQRLADIIHKIEEAREQVRLRACDCLKKEQSARCEFKCDALKHYNHTARELGRENFIMQIERPTVVRPFSPAIVKTFDNETMLRLENVSVARINAMAYQDTTSLGKLGRRRLSMTAKVDEKPVTFEEQMESLSKGMRPGSPAPAGAVKTHKDMDGEKSAVNNAAAMPKPSVTGKKPQMCNDKKVAFSIVRGNGKGKVHCNAAVSPDSKHKIFGKNQKIAVTCCGSSNNGRKNAQNKCFKKAQTWLEANATCAADGRRLCLVSEIQRDPTKKKGPFAEKGCNGDNFYTWTAEQCELPVGPETIAPECSAVIEVPPTKNLPVKAIVEHVGEDTRRYCYSHSPLEEPCCNMTSFEDQDMCLLPKRYCYNHGPGEEPCCAKNDFVDQDECLKRKAINPVNAPDGKTKSPEKQPDMMAGKVLDRVSFLIPAEATTALDVNGMFDIRVEVADKIPEGRFAGDDGKKDKIKASIAISKAEGDGVSVTTNMKVFVKPKIPISVSEKIGNDCLAKGGKSKECCKETKWDPKEQMVKCDYKEPVKVPEVEAMILLEQDPVRKTSVIKIKVEANGFKETDESAVGYSMGLEMSIIPSTGSITEFSGGFDAKLDETRPNKELDFKVEMPQEMKEFKPPQEDRCESYHPNECIDDPMCSDMCVCDNVTIFKCVSQRHPDEVPVDVRGDDGPEMCDSKSVVCETPLGRDSTSPCVRSCDQCRDRKQVTQCNPMNPLECREVCISPSERSCFDKGLHFCEKSNDCVKDCDECSRGQNFVSTQGGTCVAPNPTTCERRGMIYCESIKGCVTRNKDGLGRCKNSQSTDAPKGRPLERKKVRREVKSDEHIRREVKIDVLRERVQDLREAKLKESGTQMFVANRTTVREVGIVLPSGEKKNGTFFSDAIKIVDGPFCSTQGQKLCQHKMVSRCVDNCEECPGKEANSTMSDDCVSPRKMAELYKDYIAQPRANVPTPKMAYHCPMTMKMMEDCSSCGQFTKNNSTLGLCEADKTGNKQAGKVFCEIETENMKETKWVDDCSDCTLRAANGLIQKPVGDASTGVCEFVTPEFCIAAGAFWCENNKMVLENGTRSGECLPDCMYCNKYGFHPEMLSRQDKLDMALMSGHAGDKAREVIPMRSKLNGMCVTAEEKKTTCGPADYFCGLTESCVSSCSACSASNEVWDIVDEKTCKKGCSSMEAWCPTKKQCVGWCEGDCPEYRATVYNHLTMRQTCKKPSPEVCGRQWTSFCPSTRKCSPFCSDDEYGCPGFLFSQDMQHITPDKTDATCHATPHEAAKTCPVGQSYCPDKSSQHCVKDCAGCKIDSSSTVDQDGVCTVNDLSHPPMFEQEVEVKMMGHPNEPSMMDSTMMDPMGPSMYEDKKMMDPNGPNVIGSVIPDGFISQEILLSDSSKMNITVPDFNRTYETVTEIQQMPMFYCNSTTVFVADCMMECPFAPSGNNGVCGRSADVQLFGCTNTEAANYDMYATSLLPGDDAACCADKLCERCRSCTYDFSPPNMTAFDEAHGGCKVNTTKQTYSFNGKNLTVSGSR